MSVEHNPDKDELREALDAEVREDEAVWEKARAEFDEFCQEQKSLPAADVEKSFQKWLRHHSIALDDDELTRKAIRIAAGDTVELAEVRRPQG